MSLKKCTACKQMLDLSMFYKCAAKKDGLQHHCKTCQNFASKQHARAKRAAHRKTPDKWELHFKPEQLTTMVYEPMSLGRANELLQPYGYRINIEGDLIHVQTGEKLVKRASLRQLRSQDLPQLVPAIDWAIGFPKLRTTLEQAVA